ncbi:uncharacterized protein B0H18DRAFT_425713 [Fomitopsis serialis]|uniref:uncharacterized protein n=1 Tax=Fomitopsis serialis TaxID=139415 RepID=UPI00200809ED|nr:uncharacterized protein B0H18DRAFT_425713 [Neoantrodia serialis]KAH9924547.1 hypothetical protein B0H18DRAFT_425713 [Neoantrodia serialis]
MQVPIIALLFAISAVYSAVAQSTTALPGDTCIITCIVEAASSAGCSSYADLLCVCGSSTYEKAATSCLQSKCSSAEAQAAQTLHQDQCSYVSGLLSLSSAASTFTAAASALHISDSSQYASLSSAYSSYGSHISSEYSAYGASLSSDYSVLSSSLSVLATTTGNVVTTTSNGATVVVTHSTTANAGVSARLDASFVQSGMVVCVTTMLGIALGISLVL